MEQEVKACRRSGERSLPWGTEELAKHTPEGMSGLSCSVSPGQGREEDLVEQACCMRCSRVQAVWRTAGRRLSTDWRNSQQPGCVEEVLSIKYMSVLVGLYLYVYVL